MNKETNPTFDNRCVCPKCKSTDLILTEVWENHSYHFFYKNGDIVGKGVLEPGDPYKVKALCNDCYHKWCLDGVTQISEISQHIV